VVPLTKFLVTFSITAARECDSYEASRCKFWTFNPQLGDENFGCWIKSAAAGYSSAEGLISGEKGCLG